MLSKAFQQGIDLAKSLFVLIESSLEMHIGKKKLIAGSVVHSPNFFEDNNQGSRSRFLPQNAKTGITHENCTTNRVSFGNFLHNTSVSKRFKIRQEILLPGIQFDFLQANQVSGGRLELFQNGPTSKVAPIQVLGVAKVVLFWRREC